MLYCVGQWVSQIVPRFIKGNNKSLYMNPNWKKWAIEVYIDKSNQSFSFPLKTALSPIEAMWEVLSQFSLNLSSSLLFSKCSWNSFVSLFTVKPCGPISTVYASMPAWLLPVTVLPPPPLGPHFQMTCHSIQHSKPCLRPWQSTAL